MILPGHGDPVHDHRAVIEKRLSRYDRLTAGVGEAVGAEPRTAVEIARAVRGGDLDDYAVFFALCDVLGHLDALIDAGAAVEHRDEDGASVFAAAAA